MKSLYFIWRIESPFFYLKKLNSLFLFEEIESPFFIWRNEIPSFYFKNWKSISLIIEEIDFPYFIWRNWKSLFLFEEIEFPFFIWINWNSLFIWRNEIPLFYFKNSKFLFLFEETDVPFFKLKKFKGPFLFEEIKSLNTGHFIDFSPEKSDFSSKCACISSTILTFLPNNPLCFYTKNFQKVHFSSNCA